MNGLRTSSAGLQRDPHGATRYHRLIGAAAEIGSRVVDGEGAWRRTVQAAVAPGIPMPALAASLAYFDSYRTARLPQNLSQAQRDYFGAHTYQRIDRPEAGFVHADWPTLIAAAATERTS